MLDDDEFRKVSKGFMRTAARISAPLWWVSPDETGKSVRHNGTAFFLRTETSLFWRNRSPCCRGRMQLAMASRTLWLLSPQPYRLE